MSTVVGLPASRSCGATEGPGLAQRTIGHDSLGTNITGASLTQQHGGRGFDLFGASVHPGAVGGVVEVMDFHRGQHDLLYAVEGEDGGSDAELFAKLDANHNGTLEWSDSLSGGAVYGDGHGTMWLGLGATRAEIFTGTDASNWFVIHGVNQLTPADWQFGGG